MKKLFLIVLLGFGGVSHGAIKYLALGDSYTIGEGVKSPERWPNQLASELRDQKKGVGDPVIIARTGWTTKDLIRGLDQQKPKGSFGLVTILIGVNNQFRDMSLISYRNDFNELIRRSIKLAGGKPDRVVVLSIPDWGVTPFGKLSQHFEISETIDKFNDVNREEALKARVQYVDITDLSRTLSTDSTMLAADGLHPSAKLYKAWVDQVLPVVLKNLK